MTNTAIYKDFTFEAAHYLPHVPKGHKCGRLHGHSYKVRLHFIGDANTYEGWFIDFGDIKKAFKPILDQLDHHYLNEVIPNPTAENLAKWIYHTFKNNVDYLQSVELMETCTCGVVYPHV